MPISVVLSITYLAVIVVAYIACKVYKMRKAANDRN